MDEDMQSTLGVVFTSLPGPTRKREPSPYCYRLTYRNPQPREPGCVLMWAVGGKSIRSPWSAKRQGNCYGTALAPTPCTAAKMYRTLASMFAVCEHWVAAKEGLINQGFFFIDFKKNWYPDGIRCIIRA